MKNLEAVLKTAKFFQAASVFEYTIIVTDHNATLLEYLRDTQVDIKIKVGDTMGAGPVRQSLAENRRVECVIPGHVYGCRIKGANIPITEEDGQISGVIGTYTTTEKMDTLLSASQAIAETAQQMTAATEELAATACLLAENLAKIKQGSEMVLSNINKTDSILKIVSDIAKNSNLLGLNAAIEAARSGVHGQCFAVVADEIRKMAVNSTQSVKDIKGILQAIQNDTRSVVKTIVSTAELGERQAAATEEMAATMQNLAASAVEVETIAEIS